MPALGLDSHKFPNGDIPRSSRDSHQARFLAAYSVCGTITQAAKWAKLHREIHHGWMKDDAAYPQRFADADALFTRRVEDRLHEVGVHGVTRPVLYKGKQVHVGGNPLFETEVDAQVLLRVASARMDKYKVRVEQTNFEKLSLDDMTPEMMDKLANHMLKQALGDNPAVIAEVDRRLAAGENPTFEEAKAIEGPKE
jgi:hypothetical protein